MRPSPFPRDGSPLDQLFWRLAFDLEWVCANLVKITDKQNRLVPLVFNRGQRWVYWNMLDCERRDLPERLWILKGRQFGISTLVSAVNTIRAVRGEGANALMLVHKEAPGRTMFQKVERVLKHLPSVRSGDRVVRLAPKPTTHNTGDLVSWNTPVLNALIKRESGENVDAGVSETYQLAHLTEVPLWKDAHHTMAGFLPTMANKPGTSIIGEFTARSEGDYTHGVWVSACQGLSMFRAIFLPWYWHEDYVRERRDDDRPFSREEREYRAMVAERGFVFPLAESGSVRLLPEFERVRAKRDLLPSDLQKGFRLSDEQLLWRRDVLESFRGDFDRFRREFPAHPDEAFQSGGRRLIPPGVMDSLDSSGLLVELLDRGEYEARRGSGGRSRRVFRRRDDGRVFRWEAPVGGAFYVVCADPASGVGDDFCGAHVLRVKFREVRVVASFQGKERPHEFARILARMGQHYRCGAVSDGGVLSGGLPALLVVERNGFGEHVLYELDQTLRYRRLYRQDMRGKSDNWRYGHRLGLGITKSTKLPILNHLVQLAYDGELVVPCGRSRAELRSLSFLDELDQRVGAPRGLHDDLAMSLAEGVFVAAQQAAFRREFFVFGDSGDTDGMMFPVAGR